MRFWAREVGGWLLVLVGIYFFLVCLEFLRASPPHFLEAGYPSFIGIIVFRGGIHLLKVAMAARVCMQEQVKSKK